MVMTLPPRAPSTGILQRSALPAASSWDPKTKSATVILSTETEVGDGFLLLHNTSALVWPNRPLPCLLDHDRCAESVWGVVTDLRFEVIEGINSLVGTVTLDGAPEAMQMAEPRLRNGSARYSVGARLLEWEMPADPDAPDIITVTRWSLGELSLVVEGMDPLAIQRAQDQPPAGTPPMTVKTPAGGVPAETTEPVTDRAADPGTPSPPTPVPAAAPTETEELDRAALKRERNILRSCSAAGLSHEQTQAFIDSGKPWADVVHQIISERATAQKGTAAGSTPVGPLSVTRDGGDTLTRGLESYMSYRAGIDQEPADIAREFAGYRAIDVVRSFLESRGISTRGESINQIVDRAFHSTSDFPLLLANVARKSLNAGYQEEPQSWRPLARQRNLPDFKASSEVQLQGAITLVPTSENGEYENATLVEAAASWFLVPYARRIPIGRTLIINDDLGALNDVPEKMGRGARLTENNLVWGLLTAGTNGAISTIDGSALFVAGHNNTGAGAIGIPGVDAGVTAMRKQTDIAGNSLNLEASFLIVPPELRTAALQFLYPTGYAPAALTGAAGVNPYAAGMQLIIENRLSARSTTQFYIAASPNRVDMIRFGYLDGAEGPQITSVEKRNPDGVELLVRMDFGAALLDYRGFYRSTGV